jgi:hypothetical protein
MSYYESSSIAIVHCNLGLIDDQGITLQDDGVAFNGRDVMQCRLKHCISFAAFKQKLLQIVQPENDEHDIIRIVFRKTERTDGGVYWSTMDINNEDDLRDMMSNHVTFKWRGYIHLYVETRRTVAEILRRLTPPAQ